MPKKNFLFFISCTSPLAGLFCRYPLWGLWPWVSHGPRILEPMQWWSDILEKWLWSQECKWAVFTRLWLLEAVGFLKKSLPLICLSRSFLFFSSFHTIPGWPCLTLKLKPQVPALQLMWQLAFKGRSLSLRFVPPGRFCCLLYWVFREPIAKRFCYSGKFYTFGAEKAGNRLCDQGADENKFNFLNYQHLASLEVFIPRQLLSRWCDEQIGPGP